MNKINKKVRLVNKVKRTNIFFKGVMHERNMSKDIHPPLFENKEMFANDVLMNSRNIRAHTKIIHS